MDLKLEGLRVLVTAASQGLGLACARTLIAEGAQVIVSSSNVERARAAAAEIGAVDGIACDLTDAQEIDAAIAGAVQKLGGLDALIVNAGPPPARTFIDSDEAVWDSAIDLVLRSAVRLMRTAIPHLTASGRGRIVTITGYGIREPQSGLVASEATRAGVAIAAKALASDLGPSGVTVNNIAPGPVLTDRLVTLQQRIADRDGRSLAEQLELNASTVPVRRNGLPEDVGDLCAFLCSPRAGFITGQTIVIDGGFNRAV
ncbi:SDR family oxidoreductase [Microbacterium sp. BR1]|uniref:SDR family oxidoreductase n=1 Tax=Microbacterium sp. BR1 TaxID=1070896 RepID=UPI000C2BC572|nr:SDR family oxidoreductase [Microbacterium sp. BR1]